MTNAVHKDEQATDEEVIRDKIIHLLKIYPVISPTMLQGGLGPYVRANVWRKQLEQLKSDGIVAQDEIDTTTPSGRYNTYRRIYLTNPDQHGDL